MKRNPTTFLNSVVIIIFISILLRQACSAQDIVKRFNELPPSIPVSAPEFDVEKKHLMSIDSAHNLLYIQDIRRNPTTKEYHFDKLVYEIPLSDLSLGSFKITKDFEDSTLLHLRIGTKENKTSILMNFLRYDEVVAIQSQDILAVGPWRVNEALLNKLQEFIALFTDKLPDKSSKTSFGVIRSFHKYKADFVQTVGPKDSVKTLSYGYYYGPGLDNPPYYSGTNNSADSYYKLNRDLKGAIKSKGLSTVDLSPLFIYINSSGKVESIYFCNSDNSSLNIDLSKISTFSPGKEDGVNVKCKLLIVIM